MINRAEPAYLVYSANVLRHNTGSNHPEQAIRIERLVADLLHSNLGKTIEWHQPVHASREDILRVHAPTMISKLELSIARGEPVDAGDTPVAVGSDFAAMAAAGAAIEAVKLTASGNGRAAFAVVRPPGHHATPTQSMGFCIYNNVAIAAEYALASGLAKRIAIVDFDIHHGNGTQDAFYGRDDVLVVSSHQFPAYPGSGNFGEIGVGAGTGFNVNIPMPTNVGDEGLIQIYMSLLPALMARFLPDIILVSAGYDGHWLNSDYVAGIRQNICTRGFYRLSQLLRELSHEYTGGRIAGILEGGYHVGALSEGVQSTLRAWSGLDFETDSFGSNGRPDVSVQHIIDTVRRIHRIA